MSLPTDLHSYALKHTQLSRVSDPFFECSGGKKNNIIIASLKLFRWHTFLVVEKLHNHFQNRCFLFRFHPIRLCTAVSTIANFFDTLTRGHRQQNIPKPNSGGFEAAIISVFHFNNGLKDCICDRGRLVPINSELLPKSGVPLSSASAAGQHLSAHCFAASFLYAKNI